jgi:hypothetical protein
MRRSLWLIWLCLALLPVRGMAHVSMLFAGMGTPPGVAAAADAAPCHMGTHADALADAATDPAPHAGSCHLCAVCHSVALASLAMLDPAAPVPAPAPRSHAAIGAGLDGPDGLFRPPR